MSLIDAYNLYRKVNDSLKELKLLIVGQTKHLYDVLTIKADGKTYEVSVYLKRTK
jgi:hypothetical protein